MDDVGGCWTELQVLRCCDDVGLLVRNIFGCFMKLNKQKQNTGEENESFDNLTIPNFLSNKNKTLPADFGWRQERD